MSTIQDVAKEAGVSVATVSRVINDNGNVSEKSTQKVRAAIEKLHYMPNQWGRILRKKESKTLLILIPNMTNPYYASIVTGIEDSAKQLGYTLMMTVTNGDKLREHSFLEFLQGGRADGAIALATWRNDPSISMLAATYPIVQCCEYCDDESITHVSIDNLAAAKQVVQYLTSLSHKRIAYIGSINEYISTQQREIGYREALGLAGINIDEALIRYADASYGFQSAVRAAEDILKQKNRPSAVFCISDVVALGAIRAAQNLGLSVPEDLSVVGFDDVEYASMFRPSLTTVAQPGYLLGKTSVDQIVNQINHRVQGGQKIFLEHKLILRDSTAIKP